MRALIDDVLNAGALSSMGDEADFDLLALLPVSKDDPVAVLAWLVGLLIFMNLTVSGLSGLRGYIMARIGQRVTYGLRNEVYTHLHALSLSYYNKNETGRIMASVTQDVGRLQDFISDGLQEAIRDVLTLVIICIILFALNPGLAALVLLPTPLLVWATLSFGKRLHAIYRPLWHRWAGLSALLADTIPGVRVVKAFAQEQREVGKFKGRSLDLLRGECGWRGCQLFGPGHGLYNLHRHHRHLVGRRPRYFGRGADVGGLCRLYQLHVSLLRAGGELVPPQPPLPARRHLGRARL